MAITTEQAYAALRSAGASPSQAALLTAIGEAESGLNPAAVGDVNLEDATWGPSIGIWQERTLKSQTGTGQSRDIHFLQASVTNQAKAAVATLNSQGPRAWTMYTNGEYLKYTGAAASGATAANASYQQTGSWTDILPYLSPGYALDNGIKKKAADTASSAVAKVVGEVWKEAKPLVFNMFFGAAGLALVVIGVYTTSSPARQRMQGESQQAAQLAMLAA